MKRFVLSAAVMLGLVLAYAAGSWHGHRTGTPPSQAPGRKVLYYVDPMNPAHTSDKPGKAPCGMDLEPVYADAALNPSPGQEMPSLPPGTIRVTPEKQQLIGVRLAAAERKALAHNIRLLGKVATDETRVYRINATVNGWVTKTLPLTTGSFVRKGQTLGAFYASEFLSGIQALLFGLNTRDRALAATRESLASFQSNQVNQVNLSLQQYTDALRNLGMGDRQMQEIIETRKYSKDVDITAPADGFIIARNVSDGLRFEKGTELFRLADLSHVWVLVDVFERDASLVEEDQPVRVELPNQGRTFTATVSKTLPQFDNATRTLKLRLEVDNPDFALKPDMFVDVELPLSLAEAVVVPADAILDAGLRQTVYVDLGNGYFEPRRVYLGQKVGDQVQVTRGLEAGERIAASGTFLLDSESRMKLAAAGVHAAAATDPVCGMTVDEAKAKAAGRISEHKGKTYFFCSDGCKKQFDTDPAKVLAKAKPAVMAMTRSEAGKARDPVCGMTVTEATARDAKRFSQHQGRVYFFCNESCKEEFEKEPEKYQATTKAN